MSDNRYYVNLCLDTWFLGLCARLKSGSSAADISVEADSWVAPLRVDAMICNRTGYHYGVEFLAVDHAQRQDVAQPRMHLASFAIVC